MGTVLLVSEPYYKKNRPLWLREQPRDKNRRPQRVPEVFSAAPADSITENGRTTGLAPTDIKYIYPHFQHL